ncbi:hypothetical protein [Lignipirellula cremea]|uniref:Uncharacterized protein n=1 Tax=Lignipirellula cremea TaxID=2528010 RepID=A0A518DML1_9BACT|nr:hypothetical protein [Lignipirellula cremea]QDU93077.1 hypothetical protein Pla8534_08550 [Lignipirellula cremea]
MPTCPICQQPLTSPGARCAVCQTEKPEKTGCPPSLPMSGPPRRPPPRRDSSDKITITVPPEKIRIPPAPLHDLRAEEWESREPAAPLADASSQRLRQKVRDLTAIAGLLVALLLLLAGSLLLFLF